MATAGVIIASAAVEEEGTSPDAETLVDVAQRAAVAGFTVMRPYVPRMAQQGVVARPMARLMVVAPMAQQRMVAARTVAVEQHTAAVADHTVAVAGRMVAVADHTVAANAAS